MVNPSDEKINEFLNLVQGNLEKNQEINKFCDEVKIKSLFNLKKDESNWQDKIISFLSIRDL
jgi:hypothetical protein